MSSPTGRLPRRVRAWLVVVVVTLGAAVLASPPATAHSSLLSTSPSDGEVVAEAPDEVTLTFNEPVSSPTGGLRVYSTDGERVDAGDEGNRSADTLYVTLPPDLDDGTYITTYRVTSADGHVIRGAIVFDIGRGGDVDDDTLAAIFSGGGDTAVAMAARVMRGVGYAGALLLGGAALWFHTVARGRRGEGERAVTWARRGAWVALGAAVVTVPLQAMETSGLGLGALTSAAVLGETVGASVGVSATVRAILAGVAVVAFGRSGRVHLLGTAAAAGVLATFLIDGHTRTVDPTWLLVVGDAVHLTAAAAWTGGLVLLAGFVRQRRRHDDPVGAADLVARFSTVATWSVVAVTAAGAAMSWALVRQPRAVTSTDYGWALLVKVGLVAVLVVVGAYNQRRLVPLIARAAAPAGAASAPDGAADAVARAERRQTILSTAWGQLGRTVRFEVLLVLAVVAVTAFLVNLRPAAEEAGITGAFDTTVEVTSELTANLVVDPNRAGRNDIHLYLLDRTGRPTDEVEDVTLLLSQPDLDIGPIERAPFVAGPGHWQLTGNDLAVPGSWVIEVVVAVDRFTEERVEVPVVVNPS